MSVLVADYSASDFNSLNNFNDVLPKFDSIGGDSLANSTMKDLFRRHGVETTFGLALLHKHADLYDGERLTDIRGTSHPLSFEIGQSSIWGFGTSANDLVPLEFSIDANNIDWKRSAVQDFLTEFFQVLAAHGADKILGLCVYPGDGFPGRVEFTVGRSNVNLTPDEAKLLPSSAMREAAWFYTDDFSRRGCKCNCLNTKDHAHSHGYTT